MYGDGLVVLGVFWVGLGYFEAVGFQKKKKRIICTVMLWWGLGLGCFNGPHDGYANRSNSKTSLPRANR